MRAPVLFAALLVGGGALLAVVWLTPTSARRVAAESASAPAAGAASDASEERDHERHDARLARLEQRVDELALGLTSLGDEVRRLADARRVPAAEPAPVAPAEPRGAEEHGPAWYLEQYVASFADGGQGSEYFRLAVEAFAPSLVREIGAVVLDPGAHPLLRVRLVTMLGDARFHGHGAVIDVLLRLVGTRASEALLDSALAALQRIGDARTALALERTLWSIEPAATRWKAVQAIVVLSGEDANAVLVRLWSAADEAERSQLVGLVQPNEGEHALALFELASAAGQPVRLQAARAVGQFRFPAFGPFVDAWRARETDEAVRVALGAAREALRAPSGWSAEHAIGPPDANAGNDDPKAWASQRGDMGLQWLELDYDPPLAASSARIFEVCVPGAIASVSSLDERGGRHELWSGLDPTAAPGVFELEFALTPFRVRTLRLTLDTDRRQGWSEIDAVELVGPSGRTWASGARASSSYGR